VQAKAQRLLAVGKQAEDIDAFEIFFCCSVLVPVLNGPASSSERYLFLHLLLLVEVRAWCKGCEEGGEQVLARRKGRSISSTNASACPRPAFRSSGVTGPKTIWFFFRNSFPFILNTVDVAPKKCAVEVLPPIGSFPLRAAP
jgi:hypothetical protein